jgi:hypothetical protein
VVLAVAVVLRCGPPAGVADAGGRRVRRHALRLRHADSRLRGAHVPGDHRAGAGAATSSRDARQVVGQILAFVTERRFTLPLAGRGSDPGLGGVERLSGLRQPIEPPFFARTIHPAPPSEIWYTTRRSIS